MPRRPTDTFEELDIEELGVFEYLDEGTARFVPAPFVPAPRLPHDPVLDSRLRVELPMLWGWLFLSCFFHEAWLWMLWGAALIALNVWLRPAYEQRGLGWLFKIYAGAGLGQALFGLAQLGDLGPLRAVLGLYALGLALAWIVLELRYQAQVPIEPNQDIYDQVYYT